MPDTSFTLRSHWLVPATIEEVAAILSEPERLPDWWPAVYLAVEVIAPGDARGVGRSVAFHTRGFLPYTLRWRGTVVESDRPARLDHRGDRRSRRPRRLAARAAGRSRRDRLRLAGPGREAGPEAADAAAAPALRRQPPLGDGPRSSGPQGRARPPARRLRASAPERDEPGRAPVTGSDAGAGRPRSAPASPASAARGRCPHAAPADRPRPPESRGSPPAGNARCRPAAPPRRRRRLDLAPARPAEQHPRPAAAQPSASWPSV